jgi:hypothetical protein
VESVDSPVALAPGRAKLDANPEDTGSPDMKTTGIVGVSDNAWSGRRAASCPIALDNQEHAGRVLSEGYLRL